MDASTLTSFVKEMVDANTGGKTEDVIRILEKLKNEVDPSEELLKATKAGQAVGKLRNSTTPGVSTLAKDVVKRWKEVIESKKSKRKRAEDGEEVKKEDGGAVKKVKTEGSSNAPSPATPDTKPKAEPQPDLKPKAESSGSTSEAKPNPETESDRKPSPQTRPPSPKKRSPLSTIDTERKTPRTAKSDNMIKSLRVEDSAAGDETRDKCVVLLYDALAGDSTAETRILKERALAVEKKVYEQLNGSTGNEYRAKIRSLFLNLKDKGNPALRNEIVLGDVSAEQVVNMSKEEMASESVRALNAKIASDNLFKAKAVGETQAETDAFKCGRCHQRKCTYYQMQTRSADEPMTTFVTCTNCNNRWKFS